MSHKKISGFCNNKKLFIKIIIYKIIMKVTAVIIIFINKYFSK